MFCFYEKIVLPKYFSKHSVILLPDFKDVIFVIDIRTTGDHDHEIRFAAAAREEFFKQRNLFLAQSHASAAAEIARLNAKIEGLEADLRFARGEEADPIDGGSE